MKHASLVKLDQARQMLAEIHTVDEAKQIADLAEAARVYARQVGLGLETQNYAAEIKLRAQRRGGEVLREMEKAKGTRGQLVGPGIIGGSSLEPPIEEPPTYAEMDIRKSDAHNWQTIAAMPEERFEAHIAEMRGDGRELTTAGMVRAAKREREPMPRPEPPTGQYRVIYADPPWSYNNSGFDQSAASQYSTMATEDIAALPIGDIAADDCVLFLWATSPLLPDAFQVMAAWGFEYKASRVWVKDRAPGIGWFVRTRHELLLIGTRGSMHPAEKLDSVIEASVTKHSEKPESVYGDIEQCYEPPMIELFARNKREGWESWGNEIG